MAHPTQNAIDLIRNYITTSISGGFSHTNTYLSDTLNDPYYSGNPVPQGHVYTNFQSYDIIQTISASSVQNVLACPGSAVTLLPLLNQIPHDAINITLLNAWAGTFYKGSIITPTEYVSVTGIINATIPDPSYVSGVSWSSVYIGRSVDTEDIQASR